MEKQDYKLTHTEEYEQYLRALCRLASVYVSRIRLQFANKAYEKYQDETTRRIVLAYGEEAKKLDESRFGDFRFAAEYGVNSPLSLEDSCLNHAKQYGATIKMLFDID